MLVKLLLLAVTSLQLLSCQSSPKKSNQLPTYDSVLSNYTYPRDVQFFEITTQNQKLNMAYLVSEAASPNGKTVLLMHGKNFASWYWDKTISFLNSNGYRVVAVDQIGFGKSSKPSTYQFTLQTLAYNTKQLMDHLKINKFSLIGHSMGGMLAMRFALMYPDQLENLVLVNPIGLEDWKVVVPYVPVDTLLASELSQTPDKIKEYQRMTYFAGEWKPEYDHLIEVASGWTRGPDYHKVAWNAALTSDMVFTQPVIYEAGKIKTKTLLLIGTRDRTAIGKERVSENVRKNLGNYAILGRQTARLIAGSKLVELPGVGHMPQVEAWDRYSTEILSFLE